MKHSTLKFGLAALLALLLALSTIFYTRTITRPPACSHAWSMSDYYAMALNFQTNGLDLLHPQTYNLTTRDGITAVDFPLPAWLSALIMNLLGTDSPAVFRILTWLVSTLGFVFLYRTLRDGSLPVARAIVITLLCWSLPTLVYFHDGFIPSSWALSAFLIGFWAFSRYRQQGLSQYWLTAVAGLTLAALLRKPCVLFLGGLAVYLLFEKGNRRMWGIWAGGFALFCVWQLVDWHLMQTYGTLFLRQFRPADNFRAFWTLGLDVWKKWGLTWFSAGQLGWLGLMALALVWYRKKLLQPAPRELPVVAAVLALAVVYFFGMIRQFWDHDYYVLDSFYPAFFVLAVALARRTAAIRWLVYPETALLVLALFSAEQKLNGYLDESNYYIPEKTNRVYYASRPLLDSLEVPATARMLVFEAYSFNQPLIGMRRKGYCLLSSSPEAQERWLAEQPDYAVCLDTFFVSDVVQDNPDIVQQLDYVGGNRDLLVFRPGHFPQNSLESLLAKTWRMLADTTTLPGTAEYCLAGTYKPAPGHKILFHGQIAMNEPGEIKATVSQYKSGQLVYFQDKPMKIKVPGQFIYRSLALETGNADADEMRVYIWNPERKEVRFQQFKISILIAKE